MKITLTIFLLFVVISLHSQEWENIQVIKSEGKGVFSLALRDGMLAVNYNNRIIYTFQQTTLTGVFYSLDTFGLRPISFEHGGLKYDSTFLYVDRDGYSLDRIDLFSGKVRNIRTSSTGFYILTRGSIGIHYDDIRIEPDQKGDLLIFRKKQTSE